MPSFDGMVRGYQILSLLTGTTHRAINAHRQLAVHDEAFHVRNINANDRRLKRWTQRFHGLVIKCLEGYLGWRRILERYRKEILPTHCLRDALEKLQPQQLVPK